MSGIHEKIGRIRQSKDAKTVASNFAWLSVLQIVGYVFPLITMPYLARVIGVDGFGKVSFALSIIVIVQTFVDWGFNFTATRDVAKNRDDINEVSRIFSNVFYARTFLMIVAFALVFLLTCLIPSFRNNQAVILVTFLMIPGHIMYPDWFFQAMERMKYMTILNVFARLLFTVAVFVFVKDKGDYILQPMFTSIGFIVSGIIAMLIIRKWGVFWVKPAFPEMMKTIKGSTDVFINNLIPNLYSNFSNILLGVVGGSYQTGLLEAGNKFVIVAQQFIGVLSRAFFPFLSRKIENHSLYAKLNLLCASLMSVLLFVLAPFIIRMFFTQEFSSAVLLMRILALSLPFVALSNIYGTNYMILAGHERSLRRITVIGSVIGFIASFPLVYCFDALGAAINIASTRLLLGCCIAAKAISLKGSNL